MSESTKTENELKKVTDGRVNNKGQKKDTTKVKTSVTLSPNVLKRADEQAKEEDRSLSNIVNRILKLHYNIK